MARLIRTWRVGEVGVQGTRLVEDRGVIQIGSSQRPKDRRADGSKWPRTRYQNDALVPFVGQVVYFHDDDDRSGGVVVSVADWLTNGMVTAGARICRAMRVD